MDVIMSVTGYTKAGADAQLALKASLSSLGDAATKNTGTTAGTVAAGDDSRFSGSSGGSSGGGYYLDGAVEFGLSASETGASNATRLVNANAAAVAANLTLLLPAAIMPLDPGTVLPDQSARIVGHGSKQTQFSIPSASDNGLTIGSGPGVADNGHYGYLSDFGITGPTRPAKTSKALLLLNGLKFASVERLFINGGDIGLDLKANCYGTTFRDMWIGRYGATNVGVNLRTGLESGADIPFYNCWVGGALAAYYMSPGFTNARLFGGQATLKGADTTTAADDKGIFIVGKDYETGAVGGMGSLTVHGVDVEGWWYGWALRGYGLAQVVDFTDCSFLATQTVAGQQALGIYKLDSPYGSSLTFRGCTIKGTYSSPALGVVTGVLAPEFAINEQAWFSQTPSTVNGVGQTAQGWLESTALQSGLTRSFSTTSRGSKAQIVLDGTRFRTTTGVLEKSTDGITWSVVAATGGGTGTATAARKWLPTPILNARVGSPGTGNVAGKYQAWSMPDAATSGVGSLAEIPDGWASYDLVIHWSAGSAPVAGAFVWQGLTEPYAPGDIAGADETSGAVVTATVDGTANLMQTTTLMSGVVVSTPFVNVRANRVGAHANDTSTTAAMLVAIELVRVS